ncbi:Glycosyltransferase involved in cell wall bisynthesis [Allochromatium warmingii]|uniref:Glycosyltransferase involved in cell wall bisynthesis n=1 Tax=Allochromatium warmingii TaxID=61595 RepID=A0A1H3IW57_ALLWA|nr:glycosyltransferase [Allochromatium warmingii]SDY31993.1 Glycosyltransferase involved in cell wall bisynthesis [Allochromatium warmingii]
MKIYLLCKRYYTGKDLINDRFGRLYHLPIQLNRLGAKIIVAAIDYRHSHVEQHELDGVVFRTLPITPTTLLGSLIKLWKNLRLDPPDILIASGDSHIGYLGLQLARKLGIPFIFDVYDYYPAFASNRILGMNAFFHKAVTNANLLLCASIPLMERLALLNANRLLIENGVDRHLFKRKKQNVTRLNLGLPAEAILIGYFGSIQSARGPLLIDACHQLRTEGFDLNLLLAGTLSRVSLTETWIHYLGAVPQEQVPELIAACDLVTVPYADNAFNAMCGACKIAEYLSCGKPVVATDIAGHREIFRDAPQSLCRPNVADMAEAIRRQLVNPQIAPFPASLEWKAIAKQLMKALDEIMLAKSVL